jgi:hypothetical protein
MERITKIGDCSLERRGFFVGTQIVEPQENDTYRQ